MSMRVLFVDPDHGPRSQMAAALLSRAAGSGIEVGSAGTNPEADLAGVAEALRSGGVDFRPRRIALTAVGRAPDLLISVCEEDCEACPYLPGSGEVRRWPFPDPAAASGHERDTILRGIRDELAPLVGALARELS